MLIISLHTLKWLQVLLFSTNFIKHDSFIYTQLNGSEYCYAKPIIQFRSPIKEFQILLFNITHSFDPAKHAIPKTAEVHIPLAWASWQYGTGLKSYCTVTNRCTGRGWPVNCMTVISTRWRSKTYHSKGVDVELLYNSVHRKFKQCFGDQTDWRQDEVEKSSTQQRAGPPGLRLNSPGERERNADGHKSGEVNML